MDSEKIWTKHEVEFQISLLTTCTYSLAIYVISKFIRILIVIGNPPIFLCPQSGS